MLFKFETFKDVYGCLDILIQLIDKHGFIEVELLEELEQYIRDGVFSMDFLKELAERHYSRILSMDGWTDLDDAHIFEIGSYYYLDMPEPSEIDLNEKKHSRKYPWSIENVINESQENDLVNHPQHYKSKSGLEVIDAIEAFTEDLQGIEAVDTANIIKYICRWKKKNGLQDLEKAQWYLNNLIKYVKENENEDVK